MSGTGRAGHRAASAGSQLPVEQQEDRNAMSSTPMPFIRRAVVLEVFYDMSLLTVEVREALTAKVENTRMVPLIKRNCVMAQQITGDGSRTGKPRIYYPLLDPYISLPVKPGETVLTLFEDPTMGGADTPFWLCRAPAPIAVDDINYTHDDRKHVLTDIEQDAVDKLEGASADEIPGFPNGAPGEDSLSIGNSEDAFDKICKEALASKQAPLEAVPRYDKRPGDQVLQGSNNTLISLGTDRVAGVTNADEADIGRGAIDLVAGRGQGELTAPNTITNSRDVDEVDKVPKLRKTEDAPGEGNPDFVNDASRVYIAMKTNVDENFDIDIPDGGEASEGEKAALALKTDQLRLIARDDIKIQADSGDGNGAAIILKADGNIIFIPGPDGLIYMGGISATLAALGNTGAGAGGQVQGQPILSSMAGIMGTPGPDPHGFFSTKVLLKGG